MPSGSGGQATPGSGSAGGIPLKKINGSPWHRLLCWLITRNCTYTPPSRVSDQKPARVVLLRQSCSSSGIARRHSPGTAKPGRQDGQNLCCKCGLPRLKSGSHGMLGGPLSFTSRPRHPIPQSPVSSSSVRSMSASRGSTLIMSGTKKSLGSSLRALPGLAG